MWRLTCYYGHPERHRRSDSWKLLRTLKLKFDLPWVVIRDFNDIASQAEKRGCHSYPENLINGFNAALEYCGLTDLGMAGYPFTWERGRGSGNWVEERLDRAVGSTNWCSMFNQFQVVNIGVVCSDHSTLLLDWNRSKLKNVKRSFRFENSWLLDKECDNIVSTAWRANNQCSFSERISLCGKELQVWGGTYFQSFRKRKEGYRRRMEALRTSHSPEACKEYRDTEKQLQILLTQEEVYWKQRAKQHWLKSGDSNMKFSIALSRLGRKRTNC